MALVIRAVAPVYPSEDPAKVEAAITNTFDGSLQHPDFSVASVASEISSLAHIQKAIGTGAEPWRAYRRALEENQNGTSTWFYLNKQAAFAGRVAICQEADESPLGPIKITITSDGAELERIVDWLLDAAPGRQGHVQ